MRLPKTLPVIIATVIGGLYAIVSLAQFARFGVVSWDNAIFEQAVKSYAHVSAPLADVKAPGFNLLGDHFSPALVVLAPLYRVLPYAQTLLVAQCLLVAFSIWVVARLAIEKLDTLAGIVISLCYGVSFGLQSAIIADFHEVAFAVPMMACAGAAYVRDRPGAVIGWSLPLLLVKENMGLSVVVIGVVLWLSGYRKHGYVLAVCGAVATAVVTWLVVPAFNPSSQFDYTGELDGLQALFHQPSLKAATVAATLAVTGFVALASRWALVAVPTLAWRFIADNPAYWGTDYHYSALLMPIVFIAMIDVIARSYEASWARRTGRAGLAVALGVALAATPSSPLARLADSSTWQADAREKAAERTLDEIAEGASVETDIGVMTHLVSDHDVYWVGSIDDVRPDYVLLEAGEYGSPDDAMEYASDAHGGTWHRVSAHGPFQLVRSR